MALDGDERIISAIRILSRASSEALGRILLRDRDTFRTAHQKLANTVKLEGGITLLGAIKKDFEKIKEFLQKPESEAVGRPYWEGREVRLLDIQRVSRNSSYNDRFRCFLAERSLALEFEEWELKKYQTSRLDKIVSNPHAAEDKNGHMLEFLTSKGILDGTPEAKVDRGAIRGLKNGQRSLFIERKNPSRRGVSAIFSFKSSLLRKIPYREMGIIEVLLAGEENKDVAQLAEDKSGTLDSYQSHYDRSFSSDSNDGHDGEGIELRPSKRRRIESDRENNQRTPEVQAFSVEGQSIQNRLPVSNIQTRMAAARLCTHFDTTTISNGRRTRKNKVQQSGRRSHTQWNPSERGTGSPLTPDGSVSTTDENDSQQSSEESRRSFSSTTDTQDVDLAEPVILDGGAAVSDISTPSIGRLICIPSHARERANADTISTQHHAGCASQSRDSPSGRTRLHAYANADRWAGPSGGVHSLPTSAYIPDTDVWAMQFGGAGSLPADTYIPDTDAWAMQPGSVDSLPANAYVPDTDAWARQCATQPQSNIPNIPTYGDAS
ncbi:hypothetical protein CISG_06130 [Coccidioides immitis RMSCC 3703]|uniref:Uncharacterized protein n=1 Tax=Coccidioides immitis RMSCC 3703 TaxID=454286 RepID=A0A0J8TTJ0_COCIT|nr:hypothetical protein CISG_06130 [Coccidioides immitis RMSCC 3703]